MTRSHEWPHDLLDVDGLCQRGFRPRPFREFIFKIHQRCNLACDYCYVYTMSDQTWRTLPARMDAQVWRAALVRIVEHVEAHALTDVAITLHGGEPLLVGRDRLVELIVDVRAALPPSCNVRIGLQTNGILLDERMLDILVRHDVRIGVSLDGVAAANDRRRHGTRGEGSHAAVARGLRLLGRPVYRPAFAGLLCTIDPESEPAACYEALLEFEPPVVDFLLPHANWSRPPCRPSGAGPTPYGDWLVAVFDRWYGAPRRETRVRLLEDVISLLLGGASRSEQVGLRPVALAVVESDGSIEQVDVLKSAYAGASATGLNVFADSFDAALKHPGIVARQIGVAALCDGCQGCAMRRVCGAGHYVHRYRAGVGFRNPSVYCADLLRLISHIRDRVGSDLRARTTAATR
jgi:uncharacterized protein